MFKRKKLYISGPMTGYEEFNYPAFQEASRFIESIGWIPLDPSANFDGDPHHPDGRKAYMRLDFEKVLEADSIGFLPGWKKSMGARAEAIIAYELELDVFIFADGMLEFKGREWLGRQLGILPTEETICAEADRLVSTDRGAAYGHPYEDFSRTGRIWGAILEIPDVPPEKVALCMIGVKMSREVNHPKRDNRVDICGYAKTEDMVQERIYQMGHKEE